MLRLDLEAAGLPYADEDGRVADFHSLRAVYITALAKSRRRSSSCKAWRDTPIPGSRSTPTPRSVSTTKPTRSRRFPTWTPPFSRTTPRRPWRPGPIPLR
jgi:hypothetical protein